MPRLPDRASAEEARLAAGFSDPEWRRFIDITKEIARELREVDSALTWRQVPFNEKRRITERINARLTEEDIPAIEIELVGWRMSRVIGNLRHAEAKSTKLLGAPSAPDVATSSADTNQGTKPATTSSSASTTRTFDPIRDI
ncbi:hypothetical protein B0T12DRAFT_404416 [Alternaria alternata]|nr:hypothetical protein B0T12DRAFT_404416 [Alternaria alternata]